MQIYLTMAPEDYRKAAGLPFRTAHLAYQIGEGGRLHRRSARQTQGGLMALSNPAAPPIRESDPLCREILRTCINHAFEGVCADFGPQSTPDRAAFLAELGPLLQRSSKKLFVSAAYGRTVPSAHVLVNTALSGGTLATLLADACRTFGRERVALDIERLRMDFLLPSPTGEGALLSREALEALLKERSPSVFFSHELCAKYFTYQQDGQAHFVLFDDADTIRCKLNLGKKMALPYAFLLCSEVEDLLEELRRN